MLITQKEKELGKLYEGIAKELDIPDSKYEEAKSKYEAVGNWLGAPESELFIHKPKIFVQGSFRLGTVTKPETEKDQYDVDLVCRLNIGADNVTPVQLKQMLGRRLYESHIYKHMVEEKRRCWVINYADDTHFHMDILPAIHYGYPGKNILITDKKLTAWLISNPEGYAEWFFERMSMIRLVLKEEFAKAHRVDIDKIPDHTVKTPLQRTIQLLKRHRDRMFQNDPQNKPISIIITTLAAHAYSGEEDLYEALHNIIEKMPVFIAKGIYGEPLIANPTREEENFADKWSENPILEANFHRWIEKAKKDFALPLNEQGIPDMAQTMWKSLGETPVTLALKKYGKDIKELSQSGRLRTTKNIGTLGVAVGIQNKGHTFYGK